MKLKLVGACMAGALAVVATATMASADAKDGWITTKSKIALLTSDGFSVKGANVDTVNGNVTLHGKVATDADKVKAEETVKQVDGVKSVKNLIQVVPAAEKKAVARADADIKDRAKESLKAVDELKDVDVASVNKGVVLLSGKTKTLDAKLRAVEKVYALDGVERVATEIEVVAD